MEEWQALLACPECKGPLANREDGPCCRACNRLYVRHGGVFRFLDEGRGKAELTARPDGEAMVKGYRSPPTLVNALRKVISSEYFPGKAWRAARQAVVATEGRILVIGSGVSRYPRAIHLDLDDFPGVDVVADAHALPFRENTLDGILCEVVLEHVAQAESVIAETHRVLKKGARFFFIVPFLFPYHGHPNDYKRWSRQGLLSDFAAFSELDAGIHGGPCSSMVNLLTEWVYVLSGRPFPKMYLPIKGAATALLFPLKFLDFFVNRFPEAHRLASTLYITGRKP